jgi:hypothetical protein
MIVVGIDPSLAGAVASLDADSQLRHRHDPPVMAIRVGRPRKKDPGRGDKRGRLWPCLPESPEAPLPRMGWSAVSG